MSTLSGKVAVVTGGSRGIGLAVARALAQRCAAVAITGTESARLASAARELEDEEGQPQIISVQADVRRHDDMERVFASVASETGGVDILVNNAGVGLFRAVGEMTPAEWSRIIETNVTGVFNASRAVLPHLRARGGGWIVNVSSLSSKNPFANGAAYCASKAAVNAFSEAFMQEVRHERIRVAYVLPGSVDTTFGGGGGEKADWALKPDDVAHAIVDLLDHPSRSLPSRVEIRPAMPPRKG
jgi:3-oxoacyl-[acyl-carrier protein] reductase